MEVYVKTSTLAEYGLPQILIDAWGEKQGDELLPLQERAIREHGLLSGGSLIISAPTSSGKTFCGELAAASALSQRKKAVFLVPLKALAEERYREFREKYESLGIRTVVSTHDHYKSDREIEKGEFDLGVIIYEKFNQMLLRNLDLLKSIDLIVIDELQMLADESRGAVLEMIILKILSTSFGCRIIGLSAVLSNSADIAGWIGARLMVESHRPVELRQGVLYNGTFSYRCFNSCERGVESMSPLEDATPVEILLENVAHLANDGDQVLVFLKSKSSCVQLAAMLAERSSFWSCESAADELASGDMTVLCEPLMNAVRQGIAFHHADLSYRERHIVEQHYLAGDVRVVFATTTLALGLNLPAQTVFLETYRYRQGDYTGKPVIEPLSWSDYENMCGRAGRLKFPNSYGRSIIIAESEIECEMLWKNYIRGKPESLTGQLFSRQLPDLLLDAIVSRCARDRASVVSLLQGAFSVMPEEMPQQIDGIIAELCAEELIHECEGVLAPTAYGQRLAHQGISVATGVNLRKLFESNEDFSEIVWLFELANSFEGKRVLLSNNLREDVEQRLLDEFNSRITGSHPLTKRLVSILENPGRIGREAISRLRLVLALCDWIAGRDLIEIEQRYRLCAGTIFNAGETIAWLAEGAFHLMGALGIDRRRRLRLKKLAFEVRHGLPVSVRKLHAIVKNHLSRKDLLLLTGEGISTVGSFLSSDGDFLASLIGHSRLEEVMRNSIEKRSLNRSEVSGREYGAGPGRVKLHLSGSMVRDRFRVMYYSAPLLLTAKSFKYLLKLAAQRKLDAEGWVDKEDLEPGFNQARYLYNLKRELSVQRDNGNEVIENDRRGGYRLNLPPNEIGFDFSTLSGSDDYEVAEISKRLMSIS